MAESWEEVELDELAELVDDEARRRYFTARPALVRAEMARRLAVETGRLVTVDLERAEALCATAIWLDNEIDDLPVRARVLRATANVAYFRRRYKKAVHTYERAIAAFTEIGAELETAITLSSAIGSLGSLSAYDKAMEFASAARPIFERHGDLLRLARLENNVGLVLSRQDRFPEAIEHYRSAHQLFEQLGQPVDMATTLRNIAVCYQDLNDFPAALEAYSEARESCRQLGLAPIGLEVEYNIAYLYYLRGEYSQAIERLEEARRHSQENDDPHHEALCDLDLAEIFLELNLDHDAEHLAQRSFAAFEELGMEYEMAKALTCRALAAVGRNERQPALELLRRAGQLFARQENQVWVAMVELYRAWILFDDNRLAEAVRHADAAATGFRHAGVASRAALCEILRARLATGLGDLAAARRRGAKALEMALESGRPLLEFQAHLTTAQIAEAEGDPRAALSGYSRAHRALERLRLRLRTDELKIAFTDDKQAVYEGLVAVTLATGRSVEQWKTALGHVEMAKSRSLADLLACGPPRAADRAGDGDPLVAELGELRRALDWTYRRIGDEELEGGEARQRRLGRLRDEAREQERRLLRNLRRLRAVDHELSSLQGPFITDLESLQQALPEDGALVEYFIARDIVYRFDLDREGLQARVIGAAKPLRELCRQLQFQFGRFHVGGNHLERFGELFHTQTLTLLEELRDALLGDWRPASGIRQLIVVPHGLLHHIPFHALYDGERFLVDELSISYAPSATVFQLCATRGGESSGRSLVMAIPDERAPRILDEARAVAEILPESLLLVGEEATLESLKRLGNGCRFVHISTHGLHRRDNPMFSALELGDARLSLLDLYDLELEVELAVLSGCGTGLSYVQGSDELVGLTRGLLFAGARSVLATLWEVNDESTADLMRLFYGRLATDPRPARALQHAMATLRQTHPHPYYWAPFVLTGRP